MKIAFLSAYDPLDRKASSGTNFKMAEQLSKIGDLKWIPIKVRRFGNMVNRSITKLAHLMKCNIIFTHTILGSKIVYEIPETSSFDDCDIIAAFFCAPILPRIKTQKPIVYFTDATFPLMVNYYWHKLPAYNVREGTIIEKKAMECSASIILSSQWAADSAITTLHQPRSKVSVIEFGANVDDKDIIKTQKSIFNLRNELHLLFLGVDWERKGGKIAVETVEWLNENGIKTILHIVGIKNLEKKYCNRPYIANHGFLNKNIPSDYETLNSIMASCNAELLPTKAECSAIAFCEAAAYSLPVFTYDTGGVPNYVINNYNGLRLPLGSTGIDFGRKIKDTVLSGKLIQMSENAKNLYQEKLNWDVWKQKVKQVISELNQPK